jgi:hypothetical protein
MEETPDFTNPRWHKQRSDVELITSILDGKGTGMPAFHDRLSQSQVKMLVGKLRAFAPAKKDQQKSQRGSVDSSAKQFEIELQRLQQLFEDLRRQLEELKDLQETPAERSMPPAWQAYANYEF